MKLLLGITCLFLVGCSHPSQSYYKHLSEQFKYSCERNGGRLIETSYLDQTCVYESGL